MKYQQYSQFSQALHAQKKPSPGISSCHFELTFRCAYQCPHCYIPHSQQDSNAQKELNAAQIKTIIDQLAQLKVMWLTFSGGDPLTRPDFFDIYRHAKQRGFMISVLTVPSSITERAVVFFKRYPPFYLQVTVNSITKDLFYRMTQAPANSYEKMIAGLQLLSDHKIPTRVVSLLTVVNSGEEDDLKGYMRKLGFSYYPSCIINPKLNGDTSACLQRLSPNSIARKNYLINDRDDHQCAPGKIDHAEGPQRPLFDCVVGASDGVFIDPFGRGFLCFLLRDPFFNVLKEPIDGAVQDMRSFYAQQRYHLDAPCAACEHKSYCLSCPAKAYLETGDWHRPVSYYCDVVRAVKGTQTKK